MRLGARPHGQEHFLSLYLLISYTNIYVNKAAETNAYRRAVFLRAANTLCDVNPTAALVVSPTQWHFHTPQIGVTRQVLQGTSCVHMFSNFICTIHSFLTFLPCSYPALMFKTDLARRIYKKQAYVALAQLQAMLKDSKRSLVVSIDIYSIYDWTFFRLPLTIPHPHSPTSPPCVRRSVNMPIF